MSLDGIERPTGTQIRQVVKNLRAELERLTGKVRRVDKLLTPEEVAELTSISTGTLAQLRYSGRGPVFVKLSPRTVRYQLSDIEAWVAARRRTITGDE